MRGTLRAAATVLTLCAGVLWSGSGLAQSGTATARTIFLSSATSWTVPPDWNPADNSIEVIGGGGGGCSAGGGGGGYSKTTNLSLTPGASVSYSIGAGGTGGAFDCKNGSDTWFNGVDCFGSSVCAKGGGTGSNWAGDNQGGAGGAASSGVGSVKFSGGRGGHWGNRGSGGGGGAAGPTGDGAAGSNGQGGIGDFAGSGGGGANGGSPGSSGNGTTGGNGGNDRQGTGGGVAPSGAGSNGGGGAGAAGQSSLNAGAGGQDAIWTQTSNSATAGPGGGGGGAGNSRGNAPIGAGGAGGGYGGGGGGMGDTNGPSGGPGNGAPGIIVITYTPLQPPTPPATGSIRTSSFAYNANTGLLTQEVIEPDTPALRLQTDYTYDAFGHKVTVAVNGADIATRSASTTYDAKGQFATSAANALSHSESFEYDPRFGVPAKHTGPNGLVTTWTYDDFGRKTLELRADGTRTAWSYLYCAGIAGGTASCPAGATHLVEVKVLGPDGSTKIAPTATQYYDQLDRVIAADTEGFDGSPIRAETRYDALGRVEKKSRPYFVAGGTPEWTTFTYDALGRVLTATQPNGATTSNTFSGLTTSVTNAAAQTSTTTKNSQGQVVQVKDADNNVTSYEYEAFGNLTKVTDTVGNVTTYAYDTRGRKVTANDPDLGTATYTYDVLDKLKTQTNAASEVTTLTYDLLGRVIQRAEPGLISTWTWDSSGPKGIGKLASASTNGSYARTHTYDALGRPDQVQIAINGTPHTITTAYDAASRIDKVTYPSGFAVTYGYTAAGYQSQLSNAATSQVLWTVDARDAELHLTKQTFGNGVVTHQVFDPDTGRLKQITAGAVQSQTYDYDVLGKLTKRTDAITGLEETFNYDPLNRLISSTVHNTPTPLVATFAYNSIGNMISKSDVGTYSYPATGQPRPHGVSSISGGVINTTFTYDAKGNMTSGNGLSITYAAFNKPATITRGTASIAFDHDPEHQRYAQTSLSGVTLYIAGGGVLAERFAGSGGTVRWTSYLMAGGRYIGIHVENSDETTLTRYFHTDHLGSIAVITNEVGDVAERLRVQQWWSASPATPGAQRRQAKRPARLSGLDRQREEPRFTGHKRLEEVGLIHMNDRVYDPMLGRFGTPRPDDGGPVQNWGRSSGSRPAQVDPPCAAGVRRGRLGAPAASLGWLSGRGWMRATGFADQRDGHQAITQQ